MLHLLKRIVAALEQGAEPPSSAREARNVLRVIEAAYESARMGQRVEVARDDVAPDALETVGA